ncbi:Cdc6/Cdc18 family protein [Candidatus Altiarchaeota archaeon]
MTSRLFDSHILDAGVFKDLNVLSPHYVPRELPYRSHELKDVTRVFAQVLNNSKPNNLLIYGKTGTGKTSVVKRVAQEFTEVIASSDRNKKKVSSIVSYMNCRLGYNSKYQVFIKILEDEKFQVGGFKKNPLEGVRNGKLSGRSPTELYGRFKDVVEANAIRLMVVLDEVDMIKDVDNLIYILTRVNDEIDEVEVDGIVKRGSVSIIGISNKYSFKNDLDPRTKSTLCEEEIVFKPYNAKQLKTILTHRVKLGFKARTIAESNIGLIAAYAAQTNGDARYALKLLQKAGEIAQASNRKRVKREDVRDAKRRVEEDIIFELITTLPEHQQITLYSIADRLIRGSQYKKLTDSPTDVLFSGEVYENYERICKALNRNPRTMRWFGEYLKELEMLGLVTLTTSGSGVRGNTTLIRLGTQPEYIKDIVARSLGITD